jgi:hemolysin activation/secretion protein
MVDMTPGRRVSGSIDADNAGNYYTGKYRLGATVNYNEPLGLGDVASLRVLTSGAGLNYARGSYQMQFGKATAGVALSVLRYELGKEFESLDANGTAKVASVYGSYPLIRTRNTNLYAGLVFDAKKFQDNVDSTGQVSHKKAQVLTASLSGNHRDSLGGGGYSAYSLGLSSGNIDHVTDQTSNHFNKLALSALRLQRVTDSVSLYGAINGQVASTNLDSSEKMGLGGMYGVRAYPQGEAFADEGYLINLE